MGAAKLSSRGVLDDPLGRSSFPLSTIALPLLSDGDLLRILRIRCFHDGENGLNYELGIKGRHPILINRLRTDLTRVRFHTRVVDLCHEVNLRGFEGVVIRKV